MITTEEKIYRNCSIPQKRDNPGYL